MKTCPCCAEEIQDASVVCKHCGRDLVGQPATTPPAPPATKKSISVGKVLLLVLGLFIVLGVIGALITPSPPATSSTRLTDEQRAGIIAAVEGAVKQGLITEIDARLNKAYINPRAWAASSAQDKEAVALLLAKYCEVQGDVARITLYDAMSAKEIGGVAAGRFYVK